MSARLSPRALALLAAAAAVAALGAAWWLYASPARQDAADRGAELAALTREVNALSDTVTRLRADRPEAAARTAERLRLAKALPVDAQVPGAMVQLQHLAARSGVELTAITAGGTTAYGGIGGIELELRVTGRFHDVDDFLYRLHHQVQLDQRHNPVVRGRLFALRSLSLSTEGAGADEGEAEARVGRRTAVSAVMGVVAFTAPTDGSPDAGPPPSAPPAPGAGDDAPGSAPAPDATVPPAPVDGVAGVATGGGEG
jgi:hypothetical protein